MVIDSKSIYRDFNRLGFTDYWNNSDVKELKMHRIHSYPAKFPSLLVSKSIEYAREKGIELRKISDVFCGCGTTALEAKMSGLNFLGFDINPVATLIASVKSSSYNINFLEKYKSLIFNEINRFPYQEQSQLTQNERIQFWFCSEAIAKLDRLLFLIRSVIPAGKYQNFFLVAFSNILKKCSKWLMKSIKPQIDPQKSIPEPLQVFDHQLTIMFIAVQELNRQPLRKSNKSNIYTKNFLTTQVVNDNDIDLVITSPPYVTSYEYADLHQLSTLWLGYTDDYKSLRKGTIGSLHNAENKSGELINISKVGQIMVNELSKRNRRKSRSVGKYFLDMDRAVSRIYNMLSPGGGILVVIGNTEYNGVRIDNAKFIIKSMQKYGYIDIEIMKRKISSKILSPYRDSRGQFSNNPNDKKVYSHEFVVFAKKKKIC